MRKTIITLSALCISVFCSAQLKTTSAYDVDGNGAVNISDVSSTVEKVLGRTADNRQVVDAATLNSVLESIDKSIKDLDARLAAIESKLGSSCNCSCECKGNGEEEKPADTHEYVDLDLPSGTLWATMNVGANAPEEYGNYYAWGETKAYGEEDTSNSQNYSYNGNSSYKKTYFYWDDYKWYTASNGSFLTNYITNSSLGIVDNKKVLDLADDAAYVNWGDNWRMPTKAEQDELLTKCYWVWTTSYNGKSVSGYIVYKQKSTADTGRTHGSSYSYSLSDAHVFIPVTGYRNSGSLENDGNNGHYWSSSLNESFPQFAWGLYFSSVGTYSDKYAYRCYGQCVRAVRRQ